MASIIQLRGGTATAWTSANPILAQNEFGVETDTNKMKRGDGATAWTSLAYFETGEVTLSGAQTFTNKVITYADNTLTGVLPTSAIGSTVLGYVAPSTSGNVLTSNGTTWTSAPPAEAGAGNLTGAITSVGLATSLGSFSSSALLGALTDETGTGVAVFATSPTLVTPVLGTPSSGNLSSCTADGTDAVGFRNIPQNSQSANYTLVAADAGKHIFHPSGDANARTYTIPANASVAYPIGTALTFINMTSQVVSIAITTDVMRLAKDGTTGTRSLAIYGSATAIKIESALWLISGSALT